MIENLSCNAERFAISSLTNPFLLAHLYCVVKNPLKERTRERKEERIDETSTQATIHATIQTTLGWFIPPIEPSLGMDDPRGCKCRTRIGGAPLKISYLKTVPLENVRSNLQPRDYLNNSSFSCTRRFSRGSGPRTCESEEEILAEFTIPFLFLS